MKLKKFAVIIVAMAICLTSIACASQSGGGDTTQSAAGSGTVAGSDAAGPAQNSEVMTIWHSWTTNNDANGNAYKELLAQWEKDHPNVKVEEDATENEAYKTKIKTAIAANEAPDVFFSWGLGFAAPFAEAGSLLALDEYLADGTKDRILPGALDNFSYNGKVYGLPYNANVCALFCNKELFDKYGVKLPETNEELLQAVKTFKAQGLVPMAVGAKDAWTAMFYHNVYTVKTAGAKAVKAALTGEGSYDTPDFIKGVSKLEELIKAGAFDPSALALTYDEAKIPFMNGEIPMIYQGSWIVSEIQDESLSKVKDKVVAIKFPTVEGSEQYATEAHGGATDCFMVSSSATNKDTAVGFVKYVSEGISGLSFKYGGGIPLWKSEQADNANIDALTRQLVDISSQITDSVVSWDVFLSGEATERHKSLVQQVFAGQLTPEEFVKDMQVLNQ